MSGGHWDYLQYKIEDAGITISSDEAVRTRWPQTGAVIRNVLLAVGKAEHDMDWDLSGDAVIRDDAEFDRQTALAIIRAGIDALADAQRVAVLRDVARAIELGRPLAEGDLA